MRFQRYASGSMVATLRNGGDDVVISTSRSGGLLRSWAGVPEVVIARADLADVAAIIECVANNFDRDQCAFMGVEVEA